MPRFLNDITKAASSNDLSDLFSDQLILDYATEFALLVTDRVSLARDIRKTLASLMQKAARLVDKAFDENPHTHQSRLKPAHCPAPYGNYFTNFDITNDDRPWESGHQWQFPAIPQPSMQPASVEWLRTVGILEQDLSLD